MGFEDVNEQIKWEVERVAVAFEIIQFVKVSELEHFLGKRSDGVPIMWLLDEGGMLISITIGTGRTQCALFRSPVDSAWVCTPHRKFNAMMAAGLMNLGLDSSGFV